MPKDLEIWHENIILDAPNVGKETNIEPCVGMEFVSFEKVREFYNSFAKKRGFGVSIHSSKPKRSILVCCNEDQNKVKKYRNEKKCSTFRNGFPASLVFSRGTINSNWIIIAFNNDHNHVMVSPRSISYMKCHKKMNGAAKCLVEKFKEEGIPTGKVATIFNNGESTFSNRDCWNHIRNFWRKNLDVGDAQAIFNYCKRKQIENSNFFYLIHFFDSFLNASTKLKEFVLKFEKAVDSRLEVERREDYESRHKSRILTTRSKLEEHGASIYTRNMFSKFQDELEKINKFTKEKIKRDGPRYFYQVSNNFEAQDKFNVDIKTIS
uniref:Protein FAR1-RELATED SEQUENCE n=1 Tax=Cajanus cajan TaxID=3821 RepID=A0A151RQK9_CAJCA|nr:Protein FAR1-RELATED SEQUENCE 5 [Cajanus cajan]